MISNPKNKHCLNFLKKNLFEWRLWCVEFDGTKDKPCKLIKSAIKKESVDETSMFALKSPRIITSE